MAWHDATCAALNLEWEDGRPACLTCQRRAPALTPVHPLSSPPPPQDKKRSELVCTWPPALLSSIRDTEKERRYYRWFRDEDDEDEDEELLADILANIDEWTANTTTPKSQNPQPSSPQQPLDKGELQSVYSELPSADSVRLLRLHGSAARNDPIHCTLEIHSLHDPGRPVFEAFSYTWADLSGDSSLCKMIFLGSHYQILPVTTNCLAALRHFRTTVDRLVWVDAICINQFDLQERGHQVSLMRDIYTFAARVLMYVGSNDHATERLVLLPPKDYPPFDGVSDSLPVEASAILRMPYFSRIWVIQEIMLGRVVSVTFDEWTIHWKDLLSHIKTLPSNTKAKLFGNWVEDVYNMGNERDLLPLMKATRHCQCSDSRDRVFGLMGLVSEQEQERFSIDYDISIQELYAGLAMYWLTRGKPSWDQHDWSAELLNLAMLPKSTPFLPSWAPDWTSLPRLDANREDTPRPLIIQFDTTCIEKASSGLDWTTSSDGGRPEKNQNNWTLNDFILAQNDYQKGTNRKPLVRPLPRSSALMLYAVHILSISKGMVEIADFYGKLLHGLQLTISEQFRPGEDSPREHDIHLHFLHDWKQFLALKKHADKVYSLHSQCTPSNPWNPPSPTWKGYNELGILQVEILEHWLMDLFFYGVCAGPAFTKSPRGSRIQNKWSKFFPLASTVCHAVNFSFDIHIGRTQRQSLFACMEEILEEVRDFVVENEVSAPLSHQSETPLSNMGTLFGEHKGGMFYTLSPRTPDAEFAVRIQQAQATRLRAVPSPQHMCTEMRRVMQSLRNSCKNFPRLKTALFDLRGSIFEPFLWAETIKPGQISLLYPLLDYIAMLDKNYLQRRAAVSMAVAKIIFTAWKLLQDLKIDSNFTLEQNMNILWIHVLTMEMVVRLRGILQVLLILKAIDDKMKNAQKIYLI